MIDRSSVPNFIDASSIRETKMTVAVLRDESVNKVRVSPLSKFFILFLFLFHQRNKNILKSYGFPLIGSLLVV